jgi:hypothetical protein
MKHKSHTHGGDSSASQQEQQPDHQIEKAREKMEKALAQDTPPWDQPESGTTR